MPSREVAEGKKQEKETDEPSESRYTHVPPSARKHKTHQKPVSLALSTQLPPHLASVDVDGDGSHPASSLGASALRKELVEPQVRVLRCRDMVFPPPRDFGKRRGYESDK